MHDFFSFVHPNGDWDYLALAIGLLLGSLAAVLVLLLLGSLVYGAVWLWTPWEPTYEVAATVKALSYTPAHSSTGYGVSSGGETVLTSTSSPSHFSVVLHLATGEQVIEDNEALFNAVNGGDRLLLTYRSKTVWGNRSQDLVSWLLP